MRTALFCCHRVCTYVRRSSRGRVESRAHIILNISQRPDGSIDPICSNILYVYSSTVRSRSIFGAVQWSSRTLKSWRTGCRQLGLLHLIAVQLAGCYLANLSASVILGSGGRTDGRTEARPGKRQIESTHELAGGRRGGALFVRQLSLAPLCALTRARSSTHPPRSMPVATASDRSPQFCSALRFRRDDL